MRPSPLAEATEWLAGYRRFREGSFQQLDALLDEMNNEEENANTENRTESPEMAWARKLEHGAAASRNQLDEVLATMEQTRSKRIAADLR